MYAFLQIVASFGDQSVSSRTDSRFIAQAEMIFCRQFAAKIWAILVLFPASPCILRF
jgi:hypothetical protein